MPPEDRHSGVPGGGGSGADVKSGEITGVSDGDTGTVTFSTAFASQPTVALTLRHGTTSAVDILVATTISTAAFSWRLHKGHGGSAHTWNFQWIATDAGDP